MFPKRNRPWQDSNLQSPDPKSGALSIRPHGLRMLEEVSRSQWCCAVSRRVAIISDTDSPNICFRWETCIAITWLTKHTDICYRREICIAITLNVHFSTWQLQYNSSKYFSSFVLLKLQCWQQGLCIQCFLIMEIQLSIQQLSKRSMSVIWTLRHFLCSACYWHTF